MSKIENKNIQVRLNESCDQVFFMFTGFAQRMLLSPLDFFKKCKILDRNLVIFRDTELSYYMNGIGEDLNSFRDLVGWQKKFLEKSPWIKKIYCIGSSAGGPAALMSGYYLNADKVWVFALSGPRFPILCRKMSDFRAPRFINLRSILAKSNGKSKYDLYFNAREKRDAFLAEKLKDCDGVRLLPMGGTGHNVMEAIMEENLLGEMLPPKTP